MCGLHAAVQPPRINRRPACVLLHGGRYLRISPIALSLSLSLSLALSRALSRCLSLSLSVSLSLSLPLTSGEGLSVPQSNCIPEALTLTHQDLSKSWKYDIYIYKYIYIYIYINPHRHSQCECIPTWSVCLCVCACVSTQRYPQGYCL